MGSVLGYLPGINALLISSSGISILVGVRFIRRGERRKHMWSMITATVLAGIFLVFYIIRTALEGNHLFTGPTAARYTYYFLLASHIGVALISAPMVLTVLYYAYRGRFGKHKQLARRTYPLWLYVSATGVLVYLFLYRFF